MMGGLEGEYGILAPGLAVPGEGREAAYKLFRDLFSAVGEETAAAGGSLTGLDRRGDGISKRFLTDGGALGFEELNVAEISSPESCCALEAIAYLDRHEGLFRRAIRRVENLPDRLMMIRGPSYLPHFGPGRGPGYQLAFHLNFNARLTPRISAEMHAALTAILPLTGGGGLTERGFRISPLGRMLCKGYAPGGSALDRMHLLEDSSVVVIDGRGISEFHTEARLHFSCFDRPLTRRAAALDFAACQLMLTLLAYGEDLFGKWRLASPCRAYSTVADSEYGRRFRLAGGGLVSVFSLQEALSASLGRARREYRLSQPHEEVAEALTRGMEAFCAGDEDYLAEHFDGYLKKRVYQGALQDEGLSLDFFNNIAAPLVYRTCKLGAHLHELALLEGKEARGLLAGAKEGGGHKNAVSSLLRRNRLSAAEIPALARVVQRILTLELTLYRLFPAPSPLAEHEERLWEAFAGAAAEGPARCAGGRAARRGELIASIPEEARTLCVADWSGIYIFPARESIGIYSLPSPYSADAGLLWLEGREMDRLMDDSGLSEVLWFNRYMLWPDYDDFINPETSLGLSDEEMLRLRGLGTRPDPRQLRLL